MAIIRTFRGWYSMRCILHHNSHLPGRSRGQQVQEIVGHDSCLSGEARNLLHLFNRIHQLSTYHHPVVLRAFTDSFLSFVHLARVSCLVDDTKSSTRNRRNDDTSEEERKYDGRGYRQR